MALADAGDLTGQKPMDCADLDQPGDARSRADALFVRGRQLYDEGQTLLACACFDASQQVLPGRGGTLLNLGMCRADVGQLLAAYEALHAALDVALRDGRRDRVQIARTRLRDVEAGLAWLNLVWAADPGSTQVDFQLDGASIPRARWGSVPVEPGNHTLVATSSGSAPYRMELALTASERRTVQVAPLIRTTALAEVPPSAPTLAEAPPAERGVRGSNTLRALMMTLAVSGLVAGTVTGAWAISDKRKLEAHCDEQNKCPPEWASVDDRGRKLAIASGTTFAIGAASAVAFWLLSSRARRAQALQTGDLLRPGAYRWTSAISASF